VTLGKAVFAECLAVPSVLHSVNKLFTERRTLSSAALGKVGFAECPIKSTRQRLRHSAKSRIPVVYKVWNLHGESRLERATEVEVDDGEDVDKMD
jgi:hypothetical protein